MAIMQLFRAQQEVIFKFKIKKGPKIYEKEVILSDGSTKGLSVYNDTVIGYNEQGKECVRTTVEEPMYERPGIHFNSI
jgi:nitrate reductase beta subunit